MGTFLPNGYGLWKPTLTLDGTTKIFQTTFMFKYNTAQTAASLNTFGRTVFASAGRPLVAGNMYVGYTFARSESYLMTAGVLTYDLNESAIIGTKVSGLGTPINTSIIVKKNTGIVGKRYRGRSMLPNMTVAESNISQAGIIDGTGLGVIQGQYDAVTAAWSTVDWVPVLGHTTSEVLPTEIITLTVNPKVGSMPHRIRGF